MVYVKENTEVTVIGEALNVKGRQRTCNVIFLIYFSISVITVFQGY